MYKLLIINDDKNNSQRNLTFTARQVLFNTFYVLLVKKKKNPENSPTLQGRTESESTDVY